jgi:predicted transcriptional regulator
MPDKDSGTLAARNRDTLLTVRLPDGLKPRVEEAAEEDGTSVNAAIVAAVGEWLERRAADMTDGTEEPDGRHGAPPAGQPPAGQRRTREP